MASAEIAQLFGEHTTQGGRKIGGSLARQAKREVDTIAARSEVAAVAEQAHAFLASVALTNVAVLVNQAEVHMKVAPAGGQFYESIIAGYAIGAGQRLGRGF